MNPRSFTLLAIAVLTALVVMIFVPPIPQDPSYHQFADTRPLLGIPNFWNVVSNVPFLLAAVPGFTRLSKLKRPVPRQAYLVLCLGIALVALGSAWYHQAPSNQSLAWDRLPMTLAFMGLLSLVVSDRVNPRLGLLLLWPLVVTGAASVGWWSWTESAGAGDLRPYALVQFLPMLLIALMLWLYPGRFMCTHRLLTAFGLYVVAKLAEHFDEQIFETLGWISGHSIKHVLAALAAWFLLTTQMSGTHQKRA